MKKKSLAALLLSVSLLIGATGATTAYFVDSQKTDVQTITLGNLHVAFQPNSGDKNWSVIGRSVPNYLEAAKIDLKSASDLLTDGGYNEIVKTKNTITNVAPGDYLCKSFTLKNTGSLDAKVKLSLADVTVEGDNIPTLLPGGNHLFKAYSLNADGTPTDEILLTVNGDFPGQFVLDAKSGESIIIYSGVYLDSSINNGGMDKNINFGVKVEATQWNNPGWAQ